MQSRDAVPESVILDERSKRDTIELCGDEHGGLRCMLTKDHTTAHECLANGGVTSWPLLRAS